jgi:hypothetical protein
VQAGKIQEAFSNAAHAATAISNLVGWDHAEYAGILDQISTDTMRALVDVEFAKLARDAYAPYALRTSRITEFEDLLGKVPTIGEIAQLHEQRIKALFAKSDPSRVEPEPELVGADAGREMPQPTPVHEDPVPAQPYVTGEVIDLTTKTPAEAQDAPEPDLAIGATGQPSPAPALVIPDPEAELAALAARKALWDMLKGEASHE